MTTTVYDEVRYSNFPYAQTHPERLATVAILHGLTAPDPFRARVLEIGCGAGGNLMAMTAATPGIQALGVDLAPSAIEEGNAAIAAIGLTNLQLRQGDVRALTRVSSASSTTSSPTASTPGSRPTPVTRCSS